LTATVVNAVPASRTGIASGINNAVASTGGLLLIALLGSVCLGLYNRSLDRHLAEIHASPAIAGAVKAARNGFVVPPAGNLPGGDLGPAHEVIVASLRDAMQTALWIAALLALAAGATAALTIRSDPPVATE
jgi:hypothetical protein